MLRSLDDAHSYEDWMNEMATNVDDSDDETSLKPCPFCGAEAEIITLEGGAGADGVGAQCVQCTSGACGAASGLIYPLMDDVTHLLIERWNKRHNAKVSGRPPHGTDK